MFQELMNFSYRRTALQALSWYLVFLLIGLVVAGVAYFLALVVSLSFGEGVPKGFPIGRIVIVPYHIILGILLLWNRPRDVANVLLALAGTVLSVLFGALGGLIPLAVLTTRPIAVHFKICEHCAETIKSGAKICRYCGRDVAPVPA